MTPPKWAREMSRALCRLCRYYVIYSLDGIFSRTTIGTSFFASLGCYFGQFTFWTGHQRQAEKQSFKTLQVNLIFYVTLV